MYLQKGNDRNSRQTFAMWILAASSQIRILILLLIFGWIFFLVCLWQKAPQNPPKHTPQKSAGYLFGKIPLEFLQEAYLDRTQCFQSALLEASQNTRFLKGGKPQLRRIIFHPSGLFLGRIQFPESALKERAVRTFLGCFVQFCVYVCFFADKDLRQRGNRTRQNLKEGVSTMRKSRITQDCPFQWSLFSSV